jgi:hypothetical protein
MLDNTNSLPFIYLVTPPQMANNIGATASTTLIMQADSRFELIGIFGATDQANERTDVNPNYFACTIRDQTTGRDLMSGPVPQRVLCGNAFNGFLQKRGIVFEPQSNLLFTFTNLVAANNNVTLALHGYKLIL